MPIVYKVTSPSNKIYIGITKKTLEKRKQRHNERARNGSNYLFHKSIRKYKDCLIWEILNITNCWNEACILEKKYINDFNCKAPFGYNCTFGGDGFTGTHSNLTKQKISKKLKGKIPWNKNRKETLKERIKKSKDRGSKPFLVFIEKTDKFVGEYTNKVLCAEELNLSDGNIHSCLNKTRKRTKGYIFIYKDEYEK